MKLTACYTVFNGLELLEKSIDQIYNLVDEVIICYQTVSNKGNKCDKVEAFVYHHFASMEKVTIIDFTPDLKKNTKQNESVKHQLMIEEAKKNGSTHFFLSATDHYYHASEFIAAKKIVERDDYDVTFTKMFTYYKFPTWQLIPIEDYCMPFIMKLYANTEIVNRTYPIVVDPSVKVNTCEKWMLFASDLIMMHHYSMIRTDIKSKFLNAAASIRWGKNAVDVFVAEYENYNLNSNPGIQYFQGRKVKEVPNYFEL